MNSVWREGLDSRLFPTDLRGHESVKHQQQRVPGQGDRVGRPCGKWLCEKAIELLLLIILDGHSGADSR